MGPNQNQRKTNCGKVVINGKRINIGGGFGLEIPWEYIFEGDDFSCEWPHRKLIEYLAMSSAVLVNETAV